MRILHVVPGLNEKWNGLSVAARLIAEGQRKDGHEVDLVDARDFISTNYQLPTAISEVWVHSMWTPMVWKACLAVVKAKKCHVHSSTSTSHFDSFPRLVRMTHANLDPLRYRYHGWKKRLVAPVERWLFSKTDRVVTTGEWETEWCRQWGLENEIETVDLKQHFDLSKPIVEPNPHPGNPLKVLYLGRRHPLKGVSCLERAIAKVNHECMSKTPGCDSPSVELHVVSETFGEALEREWQRADILCLPTLSENFGLVVGEALDRGKPVIATDGAPAWYNLKPTQGVYLKGYRDGSDVERVKLLRDALIGILLKYGKSSCQGRD